MGFATIQLYCLAQTYLANNSSLPLVLEFLITQILIIDYVILFFFHYFLLSLNSLSLCTLQPEEFICNLHHILFVCSSLFYYRNLLLSQLRYFGYFSPNIPLILDSRCPHDIPALISFIFNPKSILFCLFIYHYYLFKSIYFIFIFLYILII